MLSPPAPISRTRTRVVLCGELLVEIDGHRVEQALPGDKGRQLLAHLVVERERAIRRDELIDALWPTDPPEHPDNALSGLLSKLRSAIGEDRLPKRREPRLVLDEGASVDWHAAHASAREAASRLERRDAAGALRFAGDGLAIASQPFLPDVDAEWAKDRQQELEDLELELLQIMGDAALHAGGPHLRTAERCAQGIIKRVKFRETAYELLMKVHRARGNVAEALCTFETLRTVLRDELGAFPSPGVVHLHEALLAQSTPQPEPRGEATSPPRSTALPPRLALAARQPLIGRTRDLQALAGADSPVTVVIGEPGIGKTRLIAAHADSVCRAGGQVLYGRADRDRITPCHALAEALGDALAADLSAARQLAGFLAPELGELAYLVHRLRAVVPVVAEEHRLEPDFRAHGRLAAAVALVELLARFSPLVLILDDLQWADADTVAATRRLVTAALQAPIRIVLSMRDEALADAAIESLVSDLRRDHVFSEIPLGPLDADEVDRLVATRLGTDAPADVVASVGLAAGGNPLIVEALVQDLRERERPARALRAVVSSRLGVLAPEAQSLLRVAAGCGPSFDIATVARKTRAPWTATRERVESAVHAGLLDEADSQRFVFRDEVVRRTLLQRAA